VAYRRGHGILLRERFVSPYSVAEAGWTFPHGTDEVIDQGVTFDGNDQYGSRPNSILSMGTAFWFRFVFTPDFAFSDGNSQYFFATGASDWRLYKTAVDNLLFEAANGLIFDTNAFSAGWNQNVRNVLVVSTESGDTNAWLNGTQYVANDAAAWGTRSTAPLFYLGIRHTLLAGTSFDGTFHDLIIGRGVLTDAEGERLSTP